MALPVNGSTHVIPAYYSFYRPRKDERLSWPSWLTYSGWFTHISGHPSTAGRAQFASQRSTFDVLMPRHQLNYQVAIRNARGLRRPGSHGLDELFVLVSKRYPGSLVVTSKGVSVDEQKSTSVEIFGLQVVKIKLIHYQFGNFENAKPTEIGLFTLTCSANLLHCFTRSGVCLQFCNVGLILISGHLATFSIIVNPRLSFCQICF